MHHKNLDKQSDVVTEEVEKESDGSASIKRRHNSGDDMASIKDQELVESDNSDTSIHKIDDTQFRERTNSQRQRNRQSHRFTAVGK